jgi:serine/threonine-protein kinase RsbW
VENVSLNILNLQPKLRDEFFAGVRLPEGLTVREFATFASFLKGIKENGAAESNLVLFLPKRRLDSSKARRIRLARLGAPIYIVTSECSEKDYLTYLSLGVTAILQPPFKKPDVQIILNGRASDDIPFPRNAEVTREGQVRLDFLMPSKLSRILGVNRLVSFLATEFGFPPEDSKVNFPLVMDEALSNAILHGNKGCEERKVHVRIYISSRRFVAQVEDEGDGFDPNGARDPKKEENLFKRSGRGIYLIRELMDKVSYFKGGSVLEVEKHNAFAAE